ncbi:glycosyltransferase [Microbacterium sp. MM2322]|uniref:glycosyltransferase family 4 protein n=1 Tax=Microbacterium sp. MM2322 TaxID=3157631 RepID=UPI0032D56D34
MAAEQPYEREISEALEATTTRSPRYVNVLRSTYASQGQLYFGRRFAEELGLTVGGSVQLVVRGGSSKGQGRELVATMRGNYTVGSQELKEAISQAGIRENERYQLTSSERLADGTPVVIMGRAANPVVEATSSVLATRTRGVDGQKLRVFSVIDGPMGHAGGVATASSLIVNALNGASDLGDANGGTYDIEAWNVLLRKAAGYELKENECYVFSTKFQTLLADARSGDANVWVVGHTRFSGEEALFIQQDFNADGGSQRMRRLHMVHMAPTQTAAARGRAGGGAGALSKLKVERELMADADLVAFVGNSASDFIPDPTSNLSDRSVANFLLPLTVPEILDEPIQDPVIKVLLSGRLDDGDVKGLEIARSTIRSLASKDVGSRPFQFVVLGADEGTERTLLDEALPNERAMFSVLPFVDHSSVQNFIATSAIVVLPSSADALGLAAMEGLALGRPTLVSDLSGISTFYRQRGMGRWVLPAADPAKWAERIAEIVESPESYRRACADARTLIGELNRIANERTAALRDRIYEPELDVR